MANNLWLRITRTTIVVMLLNIGLYLTVGKDICCMGNCVGTIIIYAILIGLDIKGYKAEAELLKIYESNRIQDK